MGQCRRDRYRGAVAHATPTSTQGAASNDTDSPPGQSQEWIGHGCAEPGPRHRLAHAGVADASTKSEPATTIAEDSYPSIAVAVLNGGTFTQETESHGMDAHPPREVDPSNIIQIGMGFRASRILLSAVELQLFTVLGTDAMTGEQIGELLGLHPRAIYDFLDALVALGLLHRDRDGRDGRYRNTTETAALLDKRSPTYIGGGLEMASVRSYRFWSDLTKALQTGQPQSETKHSGKSTFNEFYRDRAKLEQFIVAMADTHVANFHLLADKFDFSRYQTLCDVGGAGGQLCTILAARYPHLRCTSFDLPIVAPIAYETIAAEGLTQRVEIGSGDFFTDSLPSADVITMGDILHDWNLDRKMHLIRSAYAALPVGGAFIIIEDIIDDARRDNSVGLMVSLHMLIEFGDAFNFTGSDFADWCREVGFRQVEILPLGGSTSAGIAYK